MITALLLYPLSTVGAAGPFKPDWESLKQYGCPDWFRDARLGSEQAVEWKREADALVITPPARPPCNHAITSRIKLLAAGKPKPKTGKEAPVQAAARTAKMEKVADHALVPPVVNTSPLPDYDYDKLDYGMTIGIERTPGGRLWACWVAGGDSPDAFFVLASSDNDGETWSSPRVVLDSHEDGLGAKRSILVGNLWTDPKGRLWLIFDQSMDMFDGRAGVWVTVCENPDADEPAWSKPRRIWHGVTLNKPTVLSTGEWMLPISLDQRPGFRAFRGCFRELDPLRGANVFVSTDEGATWERRGVRTFPNPDWHEHMILEKKEGSLWMLARTRNGIMESGSTDGGRTWSEPVLSNIKHPVARFFIRRLQSGRILLIKHGDRIDAHNGRVKLSAWLSDDDGESWRGGLVLDERKGISYPDGFQAPDGTITISWDRNRSTDGEILMARFTEDDILAKAFKGPKSKTKMLISRPLAREVAKTLVVTDAEKERLAKLEAAGIVTVKPVALPVGRYLKEANHHLGWPVGIKVGKTLLCAYHQTLRHHGGGPRQDATSSDAVIVRSPDGGETWSGPIDIRTFGTCKKPMVLGFGNCFGVLGETVFLASRYGLYRSENEGRTWTLVPDALTQEQTGHKYRDNFGPRMVVHPDKGLVIPVGVKDSPHLDMYFSKDQGKTWGHQRVRLSATIHPLEPTAMHHDGHLIFVSRNHTLPFQWHQKLKSTQRPCMMVSDTGWFPMRHQKLTNISSYRWPDTTDIDFNPVTKRFEAVVTNRSGGSEENEKNEKREQTVNLWSLSKEDMVAGRADRWRFEGTLLRLKSGMLSIGPDDIDAAHPGGAVIDEENGVQHIFIYCGRYSTPAGIYRITRTLDTDKFRRTRI